MDRGTFQRVVVIEVEMSVVVIAMVMAMRRLCISTVVSCQVPGSTGGDWVTPRWRKVRVVVRCSACAWVVGCGLWDWCSRLGGATKDHRVRQRQ